MSDTETLPVPKPDKRALAAFEAWRKLLEADRGQHPPLPAKVAEVEADTALLLGYETVEEFRAGVESVVAWMTDPNRVPGWYSRLCQGERWWDREGRVHLIAEMDATYRANVVAFLRRHAVGLEWRFGFGEALSIGAYEDAFGVPDDFDIPCHDDDWPTDYNLTTEAGRAQHEALCVAWLESTRLVRSLRLGRDAAFAD